MKASTSVYSMMILYSCTSFTSKRVSGFLTKSSSSSLSNRISRNSPSRDVNSRCIISSLHSTSNRSRRRRVNEEIQTDLKWEKFEFGVNPKKDGRFSKSKQADLHNLNFDEEAEEDRRVAERLESINTAFYDLSSEDVASATSVIEPYINEARLERIDEVLAKRTRRSRFLFENPSNPSNVFACLRTIDSFGVQYVDIVVDSKKYDKPMALAQKRSMRSAMGSAHWISLTNHAKTVEAVKEMKRQGYRVIASDLNPHSKDVRELDWDVPTCVVMGNEEVGITQEMRELADETFTLPMYGFAESFNLSVATAITCAHMSASSSVCLEKGKSIGPFQPGDLTQHEKNCLRLKWLLNSLPQKKMGGALLRKSGIKLPDIIDDL